MSALVYNNERVIEEGAVLCVFVRPPPVRGGRFVISAMYDGPISAARQVSQAKTLHSKMQKCTHNNFLSGPDTQPARSSDAVTQRVRVKHTVGPKCKTWTKTLDRKNLDFPPELNQNQLLEKDNKGHGVNLNLNNARILVLQYTQI